ncbi:MAG: ABC transporter ATP-binding protein [Blastocatellia bacterium]
MNAVLNITDSANDNEALTADFKEGERINEHDVAISIRGLRKSYGQMEAVRGMDLEIARGEIFGLIGPDGAGKTSVFQILGGVMEATEGETLVQGRTSLEARSSIGYLTQAFSLYQDLNVDENLRYMGELRKLPAKEIERRGMNYLKLFDMDRFRNRLAGKLSGGMKQKLALACALITEPKLLLLDEPTSGVDPLARRAFWKMINSLADRGVAVLVTTHYLEEAEQCNRLGLMVAGEMIVQGTPTEIKAAQQGHLIELITDAPQRAADLLKGEMERWRVALFGDRLHVIVADAAAAGIDKLKRRLGNEGIQVIRAYEERFSLEDVFIAVVEQARKEGRVATED